jgi:hypothetical protein
MLGILKWIGIVLAVLVGMLFIVIVLLPPITRSFTDRWGATKAEVDEPMAGDTWVKAPNQNSTRAITIKAPPELVFALVKQMGYQRGGWYAWDWFYNSTGSGEFVDGHHSERIDPRLQKFGIGDSMFLFSGAGLKAVEFEPPASAKGGGAGKPGAMVLYKKTDANNKLVAADSETPVFSDMSWAWIVVPAGDGSTRLVLRTRASDVGQPGWLRWLNDKPLEMGGAIFGYKTLVGIKNTAEMLARKGVVVDAKGRQTAGPQ